MHEVNLTEAAPAVPAERGLSFHGLYEVFTSPTRFFIKLKDNPRLLVPWIFIGIMTLIFFLAASDMIVQMQLDNPQLQERMQGNASVNIEKMKPILKMSTIGFGTISMLCVPLIAAVLALFWGNFVMAGRATYKQILAVTLYGEVLYIFGSMILTLPLMLAKGSLAASFSLAVLAADKGIESPLYMTLSKFSVFHIWEIIVLAIGYGIVFNLPKGKAYATALLSMGLMAVIQIVGTVISASMR